MGGRKEYGDELYLIYKKEKKRKRKNTYLFSPLAVWTVAMISLFLEGVQARLMGSSAFLIYSTKWKTSYEDLFIAIGPSRFLLRLGILEAVGSHGGQDIREQIEESRYKIKIRIKETRIIQE